MQHATTPRHTLQQGLKHVISDKKAAHYFASSASAPRWITVIMYISLCGFFLAILSHLLILVASLLLVALLCMFIKYIIHKRNTTDEEYDTWLEYQEHLLRERGYQLLDIPSGYPTSSVLCIRSFVPRGSQISRLYVSQDIQMKQGRDGNWRYSVNVYTYFFPLKRGMAICKSDINVFHPQRHRDERHEMYPYSFLTTATTDPEDDRVVIEHTAYRYQSDQLYLVFSNGAMSSFSAIVQTHLLDTTQNAPYSVVPNSLFDVKLNALRALLLSEGRSTRLQP